MEFAKGTGHSLRYVQEEEFGVAPAGKPMEEFRMSSCSIVLNKNAYQSNEIRRDAQISDLRHGVKSASGDIGFDLSYGNFDVFLAAAVRGEWKNNVLVAGTITPTFTFERVFEDIKQRQRFGGCAVNSLSLDIQTDAMITGTLGIIGKGSEFINDPVSDEVIPAAINPALDGYHGALTIDGVPMAVVTGISVSIENNIQAANVLAYDEAVALIPGRINATGTLTAYFEDLTLIDKFVNEEEAAIEVTMGPGGPGTYLLKFPRVKFSTGTNPVDGEGPIMLSMSYQALLDECTDTNIIIERIPLEEETAKPCSMAWSGMTMRESVRNNGSFDSALQITLTNKEFAGRDGLQLPGVEFSNLPEGLTGKVTRLTKNTAKLELVGTAKNHEQSNSTQFNVRFTGVAFDKGFCGCAGDAVSSSQVAITLTFTSGPALPANTLLTGMELLDSPANIPDASGVYIVKNQEN